jgi:hypothetical protein
VRARVRIPLACYQRRMAELYVPTGVPVWPCHDMASAILEVRVPITGWCVVMSRRLRITSLPNGLAVCGPWWHRHRAWTENMARDMIREGTPAGEVDDLLQKMWQVEQQLQADCPLGWASESQHWRTWQGGYPTPRE